MEQSRSLSSEKIAHAVRDVLGSSRVRDVSCIFKPNADGAPVIWIQVTYDAQKGITVDEMARVTDAVWPVGRSDELPVPVIDFMADDDLVPTAAE
ncbi:hypothetical protein [Roseovarius nitratireducens]|uniref:hypothetical protein n=1 Tax=Roseovarius nitratireducens TaxID=2044597 RepID=UPI00101AD806|nr:hypothetical protein [Roseovarius nitratireducens]